MGIVSEILFPLKPESVSTIRNLTVDENPGKKTYLPIITECLLNLTEEEEKHNETN